MKKIVKVENYKNKNDYIKFFNSALPINTFTRQIDITPLVKKRKRHKLNAMLCYCIQCAAQKNESCHYQPRDAKSLIYFDKVATNIVIYSKDNEIHFVGFENKNSFEEFEKEYDKNYFEAYNECKNVDVTGQSVIATSAVISSPMLSFQSGYTDDFINAFLVWGKYERKGFKYYINVSFRFHHSIFVGKDIADFFNAFQDEIYKFKKIK